MNYAKVIDDIFQQAPDCRFDIQLWDGTQLRYGSGNAPLFTLVIDNQDVVRRLLSQGALGFGEAYMAGTLRIEGDLDEYMRLRHAFKKIRPSLRLALATRRSMRKVPRDHQSQISYHYDLGTDFFKLFLDKQTMTYSCGLYETGKETLGRAQQAKLELTCRRLSLPKGAKVLDVGSGWGGFALYAARNHGWKITGCTLSRKQQEYCNQLFHDSGMEKLITIKYQDMLRSLPYGTFDGIVVLEALEHVGKAQLDSFFARLSQQLKQGGTLYIQTTGRYVARPVDKWTLKHVFPGGYLPARAEIMESARAAGLELVRFEDDTTSYIQTVSAWISSIEKNQTRIETMFDPSFSRLWQLWTHGAKVAFEVDSMSLFRFTFKKPT